MTLTGTTSVRWVEDAYISPDGTSTGVWFAEDSRFPGVWGDGNSADEALDRMCEVLVDWWQIKSEHGHVLPRCNVSFSSCPCRETQ